VTRQKDERKTAGGALQQQGSEVGVRGAMVLLCPASAGVLMFNNWQRRLVQVAATSRMSGDV
jgi:hypothetical protein